MPALKGLWPALGGRLVEGKHKGQGNARDCEMIPRMSVRVEYVHSLRATDEVIRKMTFGPKATWVISTFPKQL
jgi:hypothetical protein